MANDRSDTKSFRGNFLLYRKDGKKLSRKVGRAHHPRFRHPSWTAAEAEAQRLLGILPESTFIILQEVGRVKLKAGDQVSDAGNMIDPDTATGCADDQTFAGVSVETVREALRG